MELNEVFEIAKTKGYYYFDGNNDSQSSNLYINFSSGINGRGKSFDLKITEKFTIVTAYTSSGNSEISTKTEITTIEELEKLI